MPSRENFLGLLTFGTIAAGVGTVPGAIYGVYEHHAAKDRIKPAIEVAQRAALDLGHTQQAIGRFVIEVSPACIDTLEPYGTFGENHDIPDDYATDTIADTETCPPTPNLIPTFRELDKGLVMAEQKAERTAKDRDAAIRHSESLAASVRDGIGNNAKIAGVIALIIGTGFLLSGINYGSSRK